MKEVFRALDDPTRRSILELLKEKDMNAGDIAAHFDMSKPSISHHLDLLRRAELISSIKKGQFVVYSLNTTLVDELMAWIMKLKK